MTGPLLGQALREFYLEPEMTAAKYVTAIMTVCDTQEGFARFGMRCLKSTGVLRVKKPPEWKRR